MQFNTLADLRLFAKYVEDMPDDTTLIRDETVDFGIVALNSEPDHG